MKSERYSASENLLIFGRVFYLVEIRDHFMTL